MQIISRNEGFGGLYLWLGLKVDEGVGFFTCLHLKHKGNFFVVFCFTHQPIIKLSTSGNVPTFSPL